MATLLHPEFEYHGLADWPGVPRVTRGREQARQRQAAEDAELEEYRAEPLELIDAGRQVVVVVEVSATGRQSRAPVRFTDALVVTVRDGRIARVEAHGAKEKALDAAGLSE